MRNNFPLTLTLLTLTISLAGFAQDSEWQRPVPTAISLPAASALLNGGKKITTTNESILNIEVALAKGTAEMFAISQLMGARDKKVNGLVTDLTDFRENALKADSFAKDIEARAAILKNKIAPNYIDHEENVKIEDGEKLTSEEKIVLKQLKANVKARRLVLAENEKLKLKIAIGREHVKQIVATKNITLPEGANKEIMKAEADLINTKLRSKTRRVGKLALVLATIDVGQDLMSVAYGRSVGILPTTGSINNSQFLHGQKLKTKDADRDSASDQTPIEVQ